MEESSELQIKALRRQLRVIYGKLGTLGLLECITDTKEGKAVDVDCSSSQVSVQLGELTREVEEFYQRLPQLPDTKPTRITDNSAAAALREYLATSGGPLGGWDEKDHLTFLQNFSRFEKDSDLLLTKLQAVLTGKSQADIESHVTWFQELRSLQEAQKRELQEWKARKQAEEESRMKELSENSESSAEDMQRWVSTWRQQREVILRKLQQWRESKATNQPGTDKECQGATNTTGSKALNTAEEREYKVLLSHLRKREKTAAKMAAAETAAFVTDLERRERAAASSKQKIQRAHQKNIEHVLQRREQIMASRNAAAASKVLTVDPAARRSNAPRDPTRLLRPTTALIAKQLQEDLDQLPKVHYILDVSHRATPSWRETSSAAF